MSPTTRRIVLYWLLLLVPTLGVGGGAMYLLRREQARLAARSESAEEARRAAVTARARLIVENIELLVGDVEAGLLDALAAEPEAGLDAFLDRWEGRNPLVRTTFRATAAGKVLRPDAQVAGEEARGFVRRFNGHFGERPPWLAPAATDRGAVEKKVAKDEAPARKEIAANVAQVQSARRDVQELFKAQGAYREADALASRPSAALNGAGVGARSRAAEAERPAAPATRASALAAGSSYDAKRTANEVAPPVLALADQPQARQAADDRRGWSAVTIDGRLHLFGWLQPGGKGDVRGVELELTALTSRLGAALPAEPGEGEGYGLRDDRGRLLHQTGNLSPPSANVVRVPLAASLLPGWEVGGYLLPVVAYAAAGAGFLGAGLLLVAFLVAAILLGGTLLLQQARRSEQEAAQKTSFVANVSHEFKTPLTTIRLYAELLEQGRVRDSAQGGEYLRTIGRETQRLARLVNNALDFSRLEQGRKKYARESLDLAAELRRLLATHEPRVTEAGLRLVREIPEQPVTVTADRDALEQIVLNLIDNACKYAADGGEIRVAVAARSAGGAEIRVGDRGPGVPAEHRERIFEKFHRVDEALTAEKTGAGLGLSIARQLARGLGGELRCGARDGGGAEFVLMLP